MANNKYFEDVKRQNGILDEELSNLEFQKMHLKTIHVMGMERIRECIAKHEYDENLRKEAEADLDAEVEKQHQDIQRKLDYCRQLLSQS